MLVSSKLGKKGSGSQLSGKRGQAGKGVRREKGSEREKGSGKKIGDRPHLFLELFLVITFSF